MAVTRDELALLQEADRRGLAGRRTIPDAVSTPWSFLQHAVWTRDEATNSIRQFPSGERFDYLRYCTEEREKHRVRAWEKSRRMVVTWWLVALYLYDLMVKQNDLSAVASDKLEKSAYLLGVDRMQLIYDLVPPVSDVMLGKLRAQGIDVGPFREDVWPNKPAVTFSGKRGLGWELASCGSSRIMAMASGSAQMQQFTFSKVLMDEFPRWQWQEESWRNIQPTTQGGGAVDIVCTAELGVFAYDLLYDTR